MDFVHVAISPKDAPPALAIFRKLRYNSISVSGCSCTDAGFQDAHFIWRMSAWRTAMEQNKNDARLVFLSRRAYETGRIHLYFFRIRCGTQETPAGSCWKALKPAWSLQIPETVCWYLLRGHWNWSRVCSHFCCTMLPRRPPRSAGTQQPENTVRHNCRRIFLPSNHVAGICICQNHVIHETGQNAYDKKEHYCPEPEPEKRLRLMNIIYPAQLLLSFGHILSPLQISETA